MMFINLQERRRFKRVMKFLLTLMLTFTFIEGVLMRLQ